MDYNTKTSHRSDLLVLKVQDFMERCAQGQQMPQEMLLKVAEASEQAARQA